MVMIDSRKNSSLFTTGRKVARSSSADPWRDGSLTEATAFEFSQTRVTLSGSMPRLDSTATPFFGIGAMRAATTWLAELLRSYPDCAMAPFKEIHFFDVRYGKYGGGKHYRSKAKRLEILTRNVARRVARVRGETVAAEEKEEVGAAEAVGNELMPDRHSTAWTDEIRSQFFARAGLDNELRQIADLADYLSIRNVGSYIDYIRHHAAGARAFGEITPTYALLPAAGFAEIDALFRGVRFIFIMRDPVERLWSQVRFRADRPERRDGKKDPNGDFRRALQRPNSIEASSYQRTIVELESVIPKNRILYLFHELMVSPTAGPAEIRRIETALGLKAANIDPKIFSTPVNPSAPARLDPENEAAALRLFAPVDAFVQRRFGRPPLWRSPDEHGCPP
jgi:hypothetical protein